MPVNNSNVPRSQPVLLFFAAIVAITMTFGVVALLRTPGTGKRKSPALLIHGAASLKIPMEQIAADYLGETGTRVELSFGGSQTLLANIQITHHGDLYLPADDSYLTLAREKKLIKETFPLAEQTAVLAVAKGNPKQIRALADFRDSPFTLSQAKPDTAAIGKLVRAATEANGLWTALRSRTAVLKPAVTDAANDVKLGAVDAAFVWDSMARQYPDLEFIRLSELENVRAKVAVGVLNCSKQHDAAFAFARFIAAPEKGSKRFQQNGFVLQPAQP